MGTLLQKITSLADIGYGVNLYDQGQPAAVVGVDTNVVGVVADLPWGPVNALTAITSLAELLATFSPAAFAVEGDWPALKAFLNKPVPGGGYLVARVAPAGQATADFTFQDSAPADSVVVTARYPGAAGNLVSVAWTANADDAAARDATVTVGTRYSATYEAVAAPDGGGGVTVTDPGDPYVTFAAAGGATAVPDAVGATPLTGGADGAAAALDYTGSGAAVQGLQLFYGESVEVDVVFGAEVPAGLVDAWNDGLESYVQATLKGMAVLTTVDDQSAADAQTYVADYRDERLVYPWPRVNTTDAFDPDRAVIEVGGESFAAVAIASVDPEDSPGGAGGARYLTGIVSLEDESASRATLKALNDAGVVPWFMSSALGGAILHRAVTTSLTSGQTKVFRRRMADYLGESIARFLEPYVETPLDLDLSSRQLGPNTSGEVGAVVAFLEGLAQADRIQGYAVDPYGANVQADLDAGRWTLLVAVKFFAMQEEIVLAATLGETVDVAAVG